MNKVATLLSMDVAGAAFEHSFKSRTDLHFTYAKITIPGLDYLTVVVNSFLKDGGTLYLHWPEVDWKVL